jgi:hypothetical protein
MGVDLCRRSLQSGAIAEAAGGGVIMTMDPNKQWRLDNANRLNGLRLQFRRYKRWSESWDHDHCAACWAKFAEFHGPDILHQGYATGDDYPKGACYEWICETCFQDLKNDMRWSTDTT